MKNERYRFPTSQGWKLAPQLRHVKIKFLKNHLKNIRMNKKPWLAALLNFFFMGLGYIYNMKRVGLGIGFTIGAIVLTYVELQLRA